MQKDSDEEDEEDKDYTLYFSDNEEKYLGPINNKQPEKDLEPPPTTQKNVKKSTKSLKGKTLMQDLSNNRQIRNQTRSNKEQQETKEVKQKIKTIRQTK